MTRVKSLAFNQGYQDPYQGGQYVQSHRVHRSKKGKKEHKYDFNRFILEAKQKKRERYLRKRGFGDEIVAY